ncbi:MAG: MFS transporter [Proteobacteria bacterium]|nr:MFS transporter [Pseudomonadota bacterium]
MKTWRESFAAYTQPRVLGILFLGFSSGLPFLLTLATLHVWLLEVGLSKTTVGLFAFATLPYCLKLLWAPLVDHARLPFFCEAFGQRKGWMLASQLALIVSLIFLGATNPAASPLLTALAAFLVASASATQDIVVEAYRIESLKTRDWGPGAGASSFGYRMGMWVSGAGSLYLAASFSWFCVYAFMAACVFVGLITTLLSQEPLPAPAARRGLSLVGGQLFYVRATSALKGLLRQEHLATTLGFIFLYKVGDTVLNTMTMPFLLEIGFSKVEIAHVAKSFGIGAAVLGAFVGGVLLARVSLSKILVLCASLQVLASLMFMAQAHMGANMPFLFLSMGIEHVTCGMGTTAYLVFLSSRCRRPFTATHFALLCSFGSLCRVCLSSIGGFVADQVTWDTFYLITAIACLPCVLLLAHKPASFPTHTQALGHA